MLIIPEPKYRRRRDRTPRVAPLTLASAGFDPGTLILRLVFDRAINISGLVPNPFLVNDGVSGTQYGGQGSGTQIDPTTLDVEMTELQAMAFPDTRLVATALTGIVAADDGGTWPGTGGVDLLLPFP